MALFPGSYNVRATKARLLSWLPSISGSGIALWLDSHAIQCSGSPLRQWAYTKVNGWKWLFSIPARQSKQNSVQSRVQVLHLANLELSAISNEHFNLEWKDADLKQKSPISNKKFPSQINSLLLSKKLLISNKKYAISNSRSYLEEKSNKESPSQKMKSPISNEKYSILNSCYHLEW